jgi:hypothetical protein
MPGTPLRYSRLAYDWKLASSAHAITRSETLRILSGFTECTLNCDQNKNSSGPFKGTTEIISSVGVPRQD